MPQNKQAAARAKAAPEIVPDARVSSVLAFHKQRKQDNRDRLMAAGVAQFCANGYFSVSVEDIATAAGVSRVTFYRHFSGKEALAVELYREAAAAGMPRFQRIGLLEFHNRKIVRDWLSNLFAADRDNRALLSVFIQASVLGGEFLKRAHDSIDANIRALGQHIPAFAIDPARPKQRRRWAEAWLLVYEIKDQSNHAALNSGIATDPVVIDILTDRFLAFVNSGR